MVWLNSVVSRWLVVLVSIVFWFSSKTPTLAFTNSLRRADDSSGKIISFRGLRAQPRLNRMAENEPTGIQFYPSYVVSAFTEVLDSNFGMELGHLMPLGFPFSATNCVFHCRASVGCLVGLFYLLAFCGIIFFS